MWPFKSTKVAKLKLPEHQQSELQFLTTKIIDSSNHRVLNHGSDLIDQIANAVSPGRRTSSLKALWQLVELNLSPRSEISVILGAEFADQQTPDKQVTSLVRMVPTNSWVFPLIDLTAESNQILYRLRARLFEHYVVENDRPCLMIENFIKQPDLFLAYQELYQQIRQTGHCADQTMETYHQLAVEADQYPQFIYQLLITVADDDRWTMINYVRTTLLSLIL